MRGILALGGVAGLSARVLAFWFGSLGLVNALANLRHPAFDPNIWWVDLRFLPKVGIFRDNGLDRILAVRQFYHPPRIKLAFARAGVDVDGAGEDIDHTDQCDRGQRSRPSGSITHASWWRAAIGFTGVRISAPRESRRGGSNP